MKLESTHIWKKSYFTFNISFLFAGDDLKTSDFENYVSVKSFDISVSVENYNLLNVTYSLKKIYSKDIY